MLAGVWRNVSALGAARITHHDLRAANVLVDADRRVRISDFTFGAVGGQEGHNYEDVAEALVSVASVVGVRRAVESAVRAMPAETLREAQPHLQTLALHRRFRRQLADKSVLVDLRETLADRLGCEVPTFRSPVRPAKVAILAAGGLAVYLLIPELSDIAAVRSAIVEHANAEQPNEACGLLVLRDGVAERYERGRNAAASPYRFELEADPELWFLEDEGYELAVFHSHLSSPPRPSRTDVENIGLWEGKPYLIYCVKDDDLAAWTIQDGQIAPLQISE